MRPYLCTSSRSDEILDLIPVLAKHLQGLTEPFMFFVRPPPVVDVCEVARTAIVIVIIMLLPLLVAVLQVSPLDKVSEVEVIIALTVFICIPATFISLKQRSFHDNVMQIHIP